MAAEIHGNQTFHPRKNFKTIILPLIVLPIFVVVGVVLLFAMPAAGVLMIIFFGALWIVMFAQGAGWWSVYNRSWKKKRQGFEAWTSVPPCQVGGNSRITQDSVRCLLPTHKRRKAVRSTS